MTRSSPRLRASSISGEISRNWIAAAGRRLASRRAEKPATKAGQIRALWPERLDLLNADGVLDRTRYDRLFERFLAEDAVFILDSGATAFLPFWSYLVEADLIGTVRAAGRSVYIHVPIAGGEMLNDTLSALDQKFG